MTDKTMNPAVAFALIRRAYGWKHSQLDWQKLRQFYDYCDEHVDYEGGQVRPDTIDDWIEARGFDYNKEEGKWERLDENS